MWWDTTVGGGGVRAGATPGVARPGHPATLFAGAVFPAMMEKVAEQLTDLPAADLDDGFAALVRVHARGVHAFLLRVSGSAAEADDLGQDTFLRACTAQRTYSPERLRELRPCAWLMTVAADVWRNHVRRSVRRPVPAVRVEDTEDLEP
ncbi:RNA polymerase sigma factor [Streptomyces sp. NPDC058373]|uniref:RNA polymerase sigma factor n=1 Tax=Streptomyces sp. NPDC058373 TaxID=3346465 RepID=UPI00365F6C99